MYLERKGKRDKEGFRPEIELPLTGNSSFRLIDAVRCIHRCVTPSRRYFCQHSTVTRQDETCSYPLACSRKAMRACCHFIFGFYTLAQIFDPPVCSSELFSRGHSCYNIVYSFYVIYIYKAIYNKSPRSLFKKSCFSIKLWLMISLIKW